MSSPLAKASQPVAQRHYLPYIEIFAIGPRETFGGTRKGLSILQDVQQFIRDLIVIFHSFSPLPRFRYFSCRSFKRLTTFLKTKLMMYGVVESGVLKTHQTLPRFLMTGFTRTSPETQPLRSCRWQSALRPETPRLPASVPRHGCSILRPAHH